MSTSIHIEDAVIYRFQEKVFGPLSLTLEAGQNYCISGHNGSGKTSLLKAIKGILPLRAGRITFKKAGRELESIFEWKRQFVAFVSFEDSDRDFLNTERYYQQRFHAFDSDDFTVEEYLVKEGFDRQNPKHLSIINKCGLDSLLHVDRIKLSSGQSRKYLIAKALLTRPKVLLLDNPYVGLDAKHRQSLNQLIDTLSEDQSIQFILAGQHTELPLSISKSIDIGKNMGTNNDKDIPASLLKYYAQIDHWPSFSNVLQINKGNIAYNQKTILESLNWEVKRGEKWAVIGDNGSGKSTLIGLIAADHPQVYKNTVRLFDNPRTHRDSIWDIKKHIGFSSSELHAYFHDPEMTCQSIVRDGLHETIYNRKIVTGQQQLAIDSLFQYFEIEYLFNRKFLHCSTGEQRLILFLRALIKNPPLFLLDEPFQCLDPRQVNRAKQLLETVLTPDHSLIFISHFAHEIPETIELKMQLS